MRRSLIIGTGSALPPRRVTNAELQRIETSDEWIVERTGIQARHIAAEGETTATLATEAARKAIEAAGIGIENIGLIVLATATPDQTFPASATRVQTALGIDDCIAFDVQAVCTGFLYALSVADNMLKGGMAEHALVIGSETFSRLLDWDDRATCVLFGDGAGAVLLKAEESEDRGVLATRLHADGRHNDLLYVDGGVSTTGTVAAEDARQEVFRMPYHLAAVPRGARGLRNSIDEVDWLSQRPLADLGHREKLKIDPARVVITVDQHANTSAASVPLALDVAVRDGRIRRGDLLVLEAMGGGFTWGAAVIRY